MELTNLLEETIEFLEDCDYTPADVKYVVHTDGVCNWDDFAAVAKEIWYDDGYGLQAIYSGLMVVDGDWWLERWEYDGNEGWEHHTSPALQIDSNPVTIKSLIRRRK